MNLHQWRKQIRRFNSSFKNNKEVFQQWNDNTIENMDLFTRERSIWNLEFAYYREKEKAMMLVGASSCLQRDVEKLKDLDDNFMIVCANSSLKYLLKKGIEPAYCICLDSDHVDIPQHLDCDSKNITLLASTVVCRKALDNWKGPIYFMPYYSIDKPLKRKVRYRLGKAVFGGGNSMTQAFYLVSVIFGSKTVIFVANEYCFDSRKKYYADRDAAKQEPLKVLYPAVDILGRKKWTLPALYNYVIWTEKVCNDLTPPGFFIDTSFGLLGKDCKNIHIMELSEAIEKVKGAFETTKKLNMAKTEDERLAIIRGIIPNEQSKVFTYNMHAHRERLLQLARS